MLRDGDGVAVIDVVPRSLLGVFVFILADRVVEADFELLRVAVWDFESDSVNDLESDSSRETL